MSKLIMVTGANGYIGKHVIGSLSQLGADIIAVDRVCSGAFSDNAHVRYIEGDVLSSKFNFESLDIVPDALLHLAWRNGFDHNASSHLDDMPLHYDFMKRAIDSGVEHVCGMGTMHEVGYWEGAIDENTPCDPQGLYGIGKNALRQAIFSYAKDRGVICQWIRGFYIYGDDINSRSIFGKLLRADAAGESTFPFTSGKNKYDFISVDDLAEQIAAVVMQDKINGIINCCSGVPVSLGDKIESFIEEHHLDIRLDYGAYPDRPYDSPAVWGDATKINSILEIA